MDETPLFPLFSVIVSLVSGDTEAQTSGDASGKRGGWITFPFMLGN
ncbi:hypothetical protein J0683_25150 [Vibrio parahaemolyticus]|nr:hypothetical protein [Vibrio parahaemolyticus]